MQVSLWGVSKTYTDGPRPTPALRPITLEIQSGEFVSLIGPSGCGKSTLLKIIADQTSPSNGEIRLDGTPPALARGQKRIAWMAQNPALLPWKTVIDNVRLPQLVNRQARHDAPKPESLLSMVGLDDTAQAYPSTLSGGMQQRVALARTLATGAPLWLMDEPFAALDELTREQLTEEVLTLWATFHPTVLWVTHNIIEAIRMADRVFVLSPGPGAIRATLSIHIPRPRDETSPEMVRILRELRQILREPWNDRA